MGPRPEAVQVPRGQRPGTRPPSSYRLDGTWSRHISRRPEECRVTWPQDQQLQDQTKNPGTSTKTSKTSARRGTRLSPMLTHETLPVSGASVVGMTYRAYHGPSNMPAGIPGVSTTSAREDRLCPKGRLHQQPAGDSTEESQSWAMKTKALQRLFRQKWAGPNKNDRGQGR
jgi:hypothetical protein